MKVKVAQSCPTLCQPMDYIVHGILWARILEWVAFPFSNPGIEPRSPTLQVDSLPAEPPGKSLAYKCLQTLSLCPTVTGDTEGKRRVSGKDGAPPRADGVAREKENALHLSRQVYRAMRGPHFLP